ncbi:AbrB/MazE/SpoVT family DNA-binding domain-containing protein [Sphingomonas sp. PAMC 26605]|jgi:AbrB family looped-hinge helix DNA binding protein|uniref:AbrB/MazE/SpoVT family DNA-binding domain-containing protein n=1 Tax=Sphingomonas sp. PAMC 26605 TaxID=1112214 RepID=UPI00026CDDB9|nr:AbrB/MazE/SpoVT family DNA-binding domain-containing protein [Sphingomonas sp. PAMC 26605]
MGKLTNLTVKGQITIPKDVRDALGLIANAPVEIEMLGLDEAVIRKPKQDHAAERDRLVAEMRAVSERYKLFRTGESTDEIMRDIRGDDPFPP